MSFQFALQKVMELKEREKHNIQAEYEQAVASFESVATELYEMLKRKEELEESARSQIANGTSIYALQQHQSKLLRLQQEIQKQQRQTHLAREKMNRKKQDLLSRSIEFKKYEKMRQVKQNQYEEEAKRLELQQMDELSIRLYANVKIR
ncbi:flagellar biosynthesis chaperone FliJ [Alkalihalobacillus oceani]|uniref:flagellar export protein FliJ n=1 Tax=Halalkalibacter oceani TaxID=1653776 RepID=UPI00203A7812|nr:flagellar export protein FliJ [Halalkalibacter oceani]MCM3759449.1 flagellar biosynthesis chaperone FliJ [Halalkalibacter oceani]